MTKTCTYNICAIGDATGFSGGLWLLWDERQVKLEVVDSNFQSITSLVTESSHKQWFFTAVYASPDHVLREELWSYLDNFNSHCTISWLIAGDFNELISDADKQGGRAVLGGGSFANWVDRNLMIDMGYIGADFTWKANRNGEEILERLDRGLCNISWRHEFPDAFVEHVARLKSDHCPIFLSLSRAQTPSPTLKPFRFEAMWLNHSEFGDFVRQNWSMEELSISNKLDLFTGAVKKWNVEVFGNIFGKKRRLIARLAGIQKALCQRKFPFLVNLEKELTKDYHELLSNEEVFWKQKSRNTWLREGDKNTRFFHLSTIIRRRRNRIEGLQDEYGNWKTNRDDLHTIAVNYFKGLFREKNTLGVSEAIPNLFPRIEPSDLGDLSRDVSELEIKNSLFSIGGLKAPGPDGIPAKFFQLHWSTCKEDIIQLVKECFDKCELPENLNDTLIALIPKVASPLSMKQLCPISICNTLYKVVSKIIVQRLRPMMSTLVSPTQVEQGTWKPVKISRNGPAVSHLFFADDLILFAEASIPQAEVMRSCIDCFCLNSGQEVSFEKSSLFCSPNTEEGLAAQLSDICGSPLTDDLGKYLGVPLLHSRVTPETYKGLVEKAQLRLTSWKSHTLSLAGRHTLIQSVTAGLPVYTMQSVRLPMSICNTLDRLNRNFLWGHTEEQKKIHLVKWDTVCKPKCYGGLGLKKTCMMNQALLAKTGWRLLQQEQGLWAQALNKKYLKDDCIMQKLTSPFPSSSSTWKGILYGAQLLPEGSKWRIGSGTQISFWNDNWTGLGVLSAIALKPIPPNLEGLRVCDVHGGTRSGDDTIIWRLSQNGNFSVKSAYHSLFLNLDPQPWPWNFIWKIQVPPKVKTFLWTLVHDRLLTNDVRFRRGLAIDTRCPRCGSPLESLDHLFRDCTISMRIWTALHPTSEFSSTYTLPFNDWLLINLKSPARLQYAVPWCCYFAMGLWYIWKWRCSIILDHTFKFPFCPSLIIHQSTREFFEANMITHAKPPRQVAQLCWHFPPKDWLKLNVDGSLHKNTGIICAGGALRNDRGEWMNGFSAKLGIGQVIEAELWGLLKGMEMAWQNGCRRLKIEMDSLVAVKLVLSPIAHLHPLYSIVANCQELLSRVWNVSLKHVYRECNSVADLLANIGHGYEPGCRFFSSPPIDVVPLLEADLLGLSKPRLIVF
ncbi:uncharacterized protein LOC133737845 [Rosa rugosa]|uniref:uncharacterized protein LOC133737845 n=1 Tax=Rosa rugosa TaxID=74645 RepID=UPI002B40D25E|nr:uncharacterized protein LOC133737845 [Rosa rugosa]